MCAPEAVSERETRYLKLLVVNGGKMEVYDFYNACGGNKHSTLLEFEDDMSNLRTRFFTRRKESQHGTIIEITDWGLWHESVGVRTHDMRKYNA